MSSIRSSVLPLAAAATTLSAAALVLALKRRKGKRIQVKPSSVRNPGQTSHIHIQTAIVSMSVKFFAAFGLVEVASSGPYVILACPSLKKHQPYVLLEEIPPSEHPSSCRGSVVGVGRLCLGVKDVRRTVERLKTDFRMSPIARPGEIGTHNTPQPEELMVAYRDPASGVILELVSPLSTWAKVAINVAQIVTSLEFPVFVHANVNVSNYTKGLKACSALGATEMFKSKDRDNKDDAPHPKVTKEVTMIDCKDEDAVSIQVTESEDSSERSGVGEQQYPTRLAFTMKDLPHDLDRILTTKSSNSRPYWTLVGIPKLKELPKPLGKTIVATMRDADGLKAEVVEYPMEMVNVEVPANVQDKVILITGCDSGFGRSLACRMSLLGFSVVAACYSQKGAKYLSNVATATVAADLATPEGVQSVVNTCREVLKGRQLWAIVNNAGVSFPGNVEWQRPELYQRAMQVNFHAPVSLIHELILDLKACPGSRILQLSSVMAMLPLPSSSAYCSTKCALEAYSDCLRCELRPYDCHVTVVQPATMRTSLGMSYWSSWYRGLKQAPPERQASMQMGDKVQQFVRSGTKRLYQTADDPEVAITAMVKTLLEQQPPSRLRAGSSADRFFWPVSHLPDSMRDSLLWNIMNFDEANAPVGVKQ